MKLKQSHRVMKKVFSDGFYRLHSGMLLFIFAMLVSYGFLINTLGTVRPETVDYWELFFAVNIGNNPLMAFFFAFGALAYAFKAFAYIRKEINRENHFFIFQAIGAYSQSQQFRIWLRVYFRILLPVLIYPVYMVLVGLYFKIYLVPMLLVFWVLLLMILCAMISRVISTKSMEKQYGGWMNILFHGGKSLYLLYFYQVIEHKKTALMVSKILSCMFLYFLPLMVPDEADNRIMFFTGSVMVLAHAVLIYQEKAFNERYMAFSLNFPIPLLKRQLMPLWAFVILLLPEMLAMFSRYDLLAGASTLLFIFAQLLLFRSLALLPGVKVKGFMVLVFLAFFSLYLVIICGMVWTAIPVALLISGLIYRQNYLNRTILE